jgi:predicted RNA-binding Zn-ribbon protein involved in translation (DUF1610 family)
MYDPDEGYWEFSDETKPTARKQHRCTECWRVIAAGEQYVYFTGKSDGEMHVYKTCRHCAAARVWLTTACDGYIFCAVLEDLREHWRDSPVYRSPMLRALIDGIEAKWHGGTDPVPDADAVKASVPHVPAMAS